MFAFSRQSTIKRAIAPNRQQGYTLAELLITLPIAVIAIAVILTIFWIATNLINRNLATNVGHLYMLTPLQRLSLDIPSALRC